MSDLPAAITALVRVCQRLECTRLTADFNTGHGLVSVVVDEDNLVRFYVDGQEVPLGDDALGGVE